MTTHRYALRDAPKQETFRALMRQMALEIVRWEAPPPPGFGATASPSEKDFLVHCGRDLSMFVLCATPHTEATLIDTRVREERITFGARILPKGERIWQIGRERMEMRGLDVVAVYQKKGQLVKGSGTAPERSITVQMRPGFLRRRLGDRASDLPPAFLEVLDGRRPFLRESRVSSRVLSIVSGLGELINGPDAFLDMHAEATALDFVAAALDTIAQSTARGATPSPSEVARIEQVRARIDEHPARHHDVEELARLAATNRTKLRAAFKQLYGMTLSDYQTAARMRLAERRLRTTELSLESIAHEVGYSNSASFVVAYKAFFGSTPGRSRRR